MIRYATIGRGNIARQFIEGAALSGRFELRAVYSREEESGRAWAENYGVKKVYTDLQKLADDPEIDAVYIASPNRCHAEQTERMLNGGKHVICEKPLVTSAAEYRRLKALADSRGLIYMEAIIPRYVPNRERVREAIGQIGRIAMARLDFGQLSSRYDALCRGEQVNIFDMSLAAGTLMDIGVYCVYAAVDLLGMPQNITASAGYFNNGADSSGGALFDYGDYTAALSYTKVGQSVVPSEIVGDSGSVTIERIGLYSGAYLVKDGERTPLFEAVTKEELMSGEATAFADFIAGKRAADYADASRLCLDVHTCMDAIKQAAGIQY